MSRYGGRRRGKRHFLFGNFYLNPSAQYSTTIVSAIVFAGFVFSGFLLFRYTDSEDLIARGKRQMAEGKVAWAAKTFENLVSRHKDSYEGHLLLGQAYLEMGERKKAEQEFLVASSLKTTKTNDNAASIAMGKLAIARKEFPLAEKHLLRAYRKNRKNAELRDALFDLYDNWGDATLKDENDYPSAIMRYERALRYVGEYRVEDKVKEKLIEAITNYADKLDSNKEYDESIHMLKKSLRYRYLPDTLIEIAESYEKANRLDDAIEWYRKAYDANPSIISIKLSNMLVKKGKQLLDRKLPDEAEQYFKEAREISASANVPMDVLYPVTASGLEITSDADEETGEFLPKARVKFQNRADRTLNFLVARATFYADEQQIAEVTQVVAKPDSPLAKKGDPDNLKTMTLEPREKLNLNLLNGHKLRVRISIAYSEGSSPNWKDLAIQETELKPSPPSNEGRPT